MSLVSELRRRNVLRMGATYLAGSWLLLQIVETMLPVFGFGDSALRYFVILLAIGFIPMLAISWAIEWTPDGLKREQDSSPSSRKWVRSGRNRSAIGDSDPNSAAFDPVSYCRAGHSRH